MNSTMLAIEPPAAAMYAAASRCEALHDRHAQRGARP